MEKPQLMLQGSQWLFVVLTWVLHCPADTVSNYIKEIINARWSVGLMYIPVKNIAILVSSGYNQ